ncbi:MAG: hypothetical protein COX19_09150, partial [Desulfobacterales bacterium CG23_combo_of_CG06-09_8_20_14_all_51_8]
MKTLPGRISREILKNRGHPMHPVLFQFGGFSVHTYGFFIALGVLSGLFLARHEARRMDLDPDKVVDACFYIV